MGWVFGAGIRFCTGLGIGFATDFGIGFGTCFGAGLCNGFYASFGPETGCAGIRAGFSGDGFSIGFGVG